MDHKCPPSTHQIKMSTGWQNWVPSIQWSSSLAVSSQGRVACGGWKWNLFQIQMILDLHCHICCRLHQCNYTVFGLGLFVSVPLVFIFLSFRLHAVKRTSHMISHQWKSEEATVCPYGIMDQYNGYEDLGLHFHSYQVMYLHSKGDALRYWNNYFKCHEMREWQFQYFSVVWLLLITSNVHILLKSWGSKTL